MKFATLTDRALIEISGDEAEGFLDNILTCKVVGLNENEASFGALLTPQGKILFDFFLIRNGNGYVLDIAEGLSEEFIKRLTFYRLRAKVTIEAKPKVDVIAKWDTQLSISDQVIQDPRHQGMGYLDYSGGPPEGDASDYIEHRIHQGIPEGGYDFEYGDAYPHEVLMDQFGGVDFKKGCYVGQEVVSRMQHRGTAKKRVISVRSETELPAPRTTITADGKPAGTMGSVSNKNGLALLRLDRIAKAENILADNTSITAEIPDWVDFSMPEKH